MSGESGAKNGAPQDKGDQLHPFDKYDVAISDDVVVAYATGDGCINASAGEIGESQKTSFYFYGSTITRES